jgi:hypothetical protein
LDQFRATFATHITNKLKMAFLPSSVPKTIEGWSTNLSIHFPTNGQQKHITPFHYTSVNAISKALLPSSAFAKNN